MAGEKRFDATVCHCWLTFVQSKAKDFTNTNVNEYGILPPFGRLNDKKRMSFQKKSLSSHH